MAYTAGLKKKCADQDLNAVLLTNRAASHFYLGKKKMHPNVLLLSQKMTLFKKICLAFSFFRDSGNMRSALNDAAAAKKLKPDHLKALIRGGYCF